MYFALMITDQGRPGVMYSGATVEEAAQKGLELVDQFMPYLKDVIGGDVAAILEEEFEYSHKDYIEGVFIVQAE